MPTNDKRVNNDPDEIKKKKANVERTVRDFHGAKMTCRSAFQNAREGSQEKDRVLTEKLDGALEMLEDAISYYEGLLLEDWTFLDLPALKKRVAGEVKQVQKYLDTVKVFQ